MLGRVAVGEVIPALGLTEPGAGSDLAGVATRAVEDGDDYLLTGSKTYITNVGVADFYTVLARVDGSPGDRDGLAMFYVPHASEGLGTRSFEVMAPHPIGEVFFDGVRVPGRHMLGGPGEGMKLALANLARFRITVAAAANGFASRALSESVAHLSRRQQFGRPLRAQGLRSISRRWTPLARRGAPDRGGRRGGRRRPRGHRRGRAREAVRHRERVLDLRSGGPASRR